MERFLDEPTAMVSGSAAWLLSRLLRSPHVVKVLNAPSGGLDRAAISATVAAIHCAGRAYESRLDQQRRDNALAPGAIVAESWTTQHTADYLRISRRRAQELATELDGKRIGRQWAIPAAAVRAYERRKAGRAA
jgi:hypothetical protein